MWRITKNTAVGDAQAFLESYGILLSHDWICAIGAMLRKCDYITVDGHGNSARLVQHFIEEEI